MATFSIRLALQDADTVKRALQGLGTEGEAALKRLESAAARAAQGGGAKSFKLLDDSGKNLTGTLRKLGEAAQVVPGPIGEMVSQVGLLGRVLSPVGLAVAGLAAGAALLSGGMSQAEQATALHTRALKSYTDALDRARDSEGQLSEQQQQRLTKELTLARNQLTLALDLEKRAVAARAALADLGNPLNAADRTPAEQQLSALTLALRSGQTSIEDYREAVTGLALANPELAGRAAEVNDLTANYDRLQGELAATTAALVDVADGTLDAGAAMRSAAGDAVAFGQALAGINDSTADLQARMAAFAAGGVEGYKAMIEQQRLETQATREAEAAVKDFVGTAEQRKIAYDQIYAQSLTTAQGLAGLAAEVARLEAEQRAGAQSATAFESALGALLDRLDPLVAAQQRFADEQALLNRALAQGRISDDAAAAAKARLAEAYADQLDPVGAVLESLRDEARLAALSARERDRHNRILAEENKLRAAGVTVTNAQLQAIEAEVDAILRANEASAAAETAAADALQRAKDFEQEVSRVSESIADDLTTALFEGAESGFDDILGSIGKWMERIALEVLKQQIVLPITTQLVGAVPGLFGVSGGGGAGGNGFNVFGAVTDLASSGFDWLGRTLGFGPSAQSFASQYGTVGAARNFAPGLFDSVAGQMGFGGLDLGSLLGSGAAGYGIGSLVGGFSPFGRTGPGASIGGALGGLAGSFLPFPGGDLLGGLLGGIFGSMFGAKPSSGPFGLGTARTSGGRLAYTTTSNLKGGVGDMAPLVNETAGIANAIADLFGGEFTDALLRIGYVNNEKGEKGYVVGGARPAGSDPNYVFNNWRKFGENKEAAQVFALRQAILGGTFNGGIQTGSGLQGLGAEEKQYLGKSFSIRTTTEELLKDAALIADLFGETEAAMSEASAALRDLNQAYDEQVARARELGIAEEQLEARRAEAIADLKGGFLEGIGDQILAITDPLAFAIKQLDREFETIRANAEDFGVGLVEVERLYGLKRAQILEQIAQSTVSDLQRFLEELQFGALSGGAPGARLEDARAAFDAASAAALSGDAAARGRVQDLGTTLLGLSRGYNASGAGYFDDLGRVQDVVEALLAEMPGYASGVLGAPGGWSLVGERGPEAMFVPRGASILPAPFTRLLQGAGAGGLAGGRLAGSDGPLREIARLQAENIQAIRQKLGLDEELRNELRQLGSGLRRLLSLLPPRSA